MQNKLAITDKSFFLQFLLGYFSCLISIYEKMGPKIKITARFIALNKIVAAIASVNGIPIKFAENMLIASPTPKFPGVIATSIDSEPTDAINNALKKPIWILNKLYVIIVLIAPSINCTKPIMVVMNNTSLLSLIKCQPLITLINLFIKSE